jgi:aspartate kinase
VALAAAFGRARCEIHTDVSGIYSADPRVAPRARVIPRLDYRACSTLAHLGGRVLHARCVDLAAREGVPLVVRSSFDEAGGTEIGEFEMEGPRVEAVTHRGDCSIAVAERNGGGRGEARGLIEAVADTFPELELVSHEQAPDGHHALVWTGTRADVAALSKDFRARLGPGGEWTLRTEHDAAFVSVVGLGLGAREAAHAEGALERAQVPLIALRVSPHALVFRVPGERVEDAVRALHAALVERPD